MMNSMLKTNVITPWILPFTNEQNGRIRLFFFPHAGGGASTFFQWSRLLPAFVNSCAIQLPGRETRFREPLHREIRPLVQTMTAVLQPYLDEPFVFWGHSMGALLAFEVARTLQQQNLLPQRLLVSGHNAPHVPYADPHVHQAPRADFIAALQKLNGIPEMVLENEELLNLVLPILRGDFQLVETYKYHDGLPLSCPITVLDGASDEKTNDTDLQAWQKQTTLPLEMFSFPGDHFFLFDYQPQLVSKVTHLFNRQLLYTQG
jgi:medium-chain acyl-[acyl-carrier-protein] hydrolase